MATTATYYSAWQGSWTGFRLRLTITRESVNIANNQSKIRARVWVESRNGSSFSYDSLHQQYIDGATVYSGTIARSCPANGQILVLDNERWITHNADGSRSVQCGAVFENSITGSMAVSGSLNVDVIPRATTPSFSGSFTTGSAKTISLPRASTSFTHEVKYKFGSKSGTISSSAGASVSWTPPESLLTEIPKATSGSGTITVVTKSGSTTVGTKSKSFKLVAASSVVPTVSAVTWEDTNTAIKNAIGAFVQGLSTVRGTVTASGVHGSTISSRRTKIGSSTVAAGTAVRVTGSGAVSGSGEATDSRGRVGSRTANLTVLAYKAPTVTKLEVDRATSNGTLSGTGTYLKLTLAASVQSLIVGSKQKNAASISIKTRTGGGAWVTRGTPITPGLTYNSSVVIPGGGVFVTTNSYDVRVEVADACGQLHVAETTVGTASVTLDLRGTNVGVGKYHEQGVLDVAGEIYSDGYLVRPFPTFTLKSQMNAWAPIDGIHAWVTAEDREYVRMGGKWWRVPIVWSTTGLVAGTSAAEGSVYVAFPAGLFPATPAVTVTPHTSVPGTRDVKVGIAANASGCTVYLARSNTGDTGFSLTATLS